MDNHPLTPIPTKVAPLLPFGERARTETTRLERNKTTLSAVGCQAAIVLPQNQKQRRVSAFTELIIVASTVDERDAWM